MGAIVGLFETSYEELLKSKFEPIGTFGYCSKFERAGIPRDVGWLSVSSSV